MKNKSVVILSGAGISAESGLGTFRDSDGLWEQYDLNEVATIDGWRRNPALVLDFYDQRREQVLRAQPNTAHLALKELERLYDVTIITQNIDDLHERAGSSKIIHLHGEILKGRSVKTDRELYPVKTSIKLGDLAPDGHQLRPHVVWFGEEVPKMVEAENVVRKADILIVVGTSLNVYPAAGLRYAVKNHATCYLVDPNEMNITDQHFYHYQGNACAMIPLLVEELLAK